MDELIQDVRLAGRTLLKSPGFTVVIVCTLALGIGANAAIFTILDQVLLRTLPVDHPEELVLLDGPGPNKGAIFNDNAFSYPMYRDFRDNTKVFSGVLARYRTSLSLTYRNQTERVAGELVSGNYFEVLGIHPSLGRALTPDDDRTRGAHPVAVLTHGYWTRRFGADPGILNQTLVLNGHPMTIIGVGPAGFHGVEVGTTSDVLVPMMMKAQMTPTWDDLENRRTMWLNVFARLSHGVSRREAEASMNVLYRQILEEEVKGIRDVPARFRERFVTKHLDLIPGLRGRSSLRSELSTPLVSLMAMVGLVLLIACANVANLLTARATARQRDVAIRLALGAGKRQIVRQLLVESVLLSLAGGALGVLLAFWTGEFLLAAVPSEEATRAFTAEPDLRVVAFTLGISVLTGILFGLFPALQSTRPVLTSTLKDEAGTLAGSSPHLRFRKALVVAQVALSLLLLVGAGLFARSLYNLTTLNPGFLAQNLATFSIDPSLNGYAQDRILRLFSELQEEIERVPGVVSASMAEVSFLSGDSAIATVKVEGYTVKEGENVNPHYNGVGPGFFATMGIPLLAGREFTTHDGPGAPRVGIVNETMARYFFGTESPLGRHFGFGRGSAMDIEIVGVVKDGKAQSLREEIPRYVYIPYTQEDGLSGMSFYVRNAEGPDATASALRRLVQQVDPALPVFNVKTMVAQVDESLFVERMVAVLSACFGLLATLLAAIGLYGVMSYTIARRTREIGIRMALGAERHAVLWLVLREVAVMAAIGMAIGLPAAKGLSRFIQLQLFGLSGADALTLAFATATLSLVALFAGYVPARRASRIDPMIALRYE